VIRGVLCVVVIVLLLICQCPGCLEDTRAQTGDSQTAQTQAMHTPGFPVGGAPVGDCVVKIGGVPVQADTHAIVIPNEPTPQESYAAGELQGHIRLITGQELPVLGEAEAGDRTALAVGNTGLLRGLNPPPDLAGLGVEGIHIRTDGSTLILAGNKRGVLYATYVFLEDYLGCRWFTADCATWPATGAIEVPPIDRRYIPPLEYRCTDYPNARLANFALRNRLNGRDQRLSEEQGGKVTYKGFVHTFDALVPPSKYFASHPEYYSQIDGKRVGPEGTQLCLSNPDVLRIATATVRSWLAEDPDVDIISVSQNDNPNYCRCPQCNRLAEQEGSQSGPLLQFVNAIAADIAADYPSVLIDTLAYAYTRKPPRSARPRENVVVRLCSLECCFLHPLATDPVNASFVQDLEGWSRICPRLHLWDYVANFNHSISPYPNLQVVKPNVSLLLSKGCKGVYEEGCYYTKGAELAELRSYLIAKTLWDPNYDTDRAINEFSAAYYGAAATYVERYVELVKTTALNTPNFHLYLRTPPTAEYITSELLSEADALFDQAEAAVSGDETLLHRVQVARLPVMYAEIMRQQDSLYSEQGDQLVLAGSTDLQALAARFGEIASAEEVIRVSEGGPTAPLDAWLQSLSFPPRELAIVRLRSRSLTASVLPALGGRIWRLQLAGSGRDLLAVGRAGGMFQPNRLGYSETVEAGRSALGRYDTYAVTQQSANSVTMEADIGRGLAMTRTVFLDSNQPIARIRSTVLKRSPGPGSVIWWANGALSVASVGRAEVRVRQNNGSWRTVQLPSTGTAGSEGRTQLRGGNMPAGAWAVVDRGANLAILNSIAQRALDKCLILWDDKEARVNFQIYSPSTPLKPGESFTVEQSYQVYQPASALPAR